MRSVKESRNDAWRDGVRRGVAASIDGEQHEPL